MFDTISNKSEIFSSEVLRIQCTFLQEHMSLMEIQRPGILRICQVIIE